jgi:hypothetical protein
VNIAVFLSRKDVGPDRKIVVVAVDQFEREHRLETPHDTRQPASHLGLNPCILCELGSI